MKKRLLLGLGITAAFLNTAAGQAPFTSGNLVAFQAGADGGVDPLTATAVPSFLKEITVGGTVVQTITLPSALAATGNRAVNTRGTSTSEGFISRSVDGQYLTFAGINVDVGGLPNAAGVTRAVGRVNAAGVVDTSTELTDGSYSGDSIRSAVSTNGTDIWIGGTSSTGANGGVRYTTFGSNSSLAVNIIEPRNMRVVKIFNNQLYVSTMTSTFRGVNTVGTGIPTTAGNSLVLLPGFDPNAASLQSVYDFFFLNANTLYVADDRTIANGGGIQKWTFDAGPGIWSLAYTLNSGLTTGTRAMTAVVNTGVPTFYATTAVANANAGNSIVTVTDTGAASTFSIVATSQANTWFKGLDFAPAGGPAPCYANCDATGGLTANDFICFLTAFNNGASYADCDGVGGLTANDFICFVTAYNNGCS